jgi:hypothetical protein
MIQDKINEKTERRRTKPIRPKGGMLKLRNALNTVFIVGAVAGLIYYFTADEQTGIIIILCAMAFKFIESAIRLLRL